MISSVFLLPAFAGALTNLHSHSKVSDVLSLDASARHAATDERCQPERRLSFARSAVVHSNLGGEGPDILAPEELLFGDVFPMSNTTVDLKVTLASPRDEYSATENGLQGPMGVINLQPGGRIEVDFRLLERSTGQPYMQDFYFTMVDLYPSTDGHPGNSVSFLKTFSQFLSSATNIQTTQDGSDTVFSSAGAFTTPVSSDPLLLSDAEMGFSVTVGANASFFRVRMDNAMGNEARKFRFAGASSLVCDEPASCATMECPVHLGMTRKPSAQHIACRAANCTAEHDTLTCCETVNTPCAVDRMMTLLPENVIQHDLRSTQNGVSSFVDGAIVIGDVFPMSSSKIDLRITVDGDYTPSSSQQAPASGSEAVLPGYCSNFALMPDGKLTMPASLFGSAAAEWCIGKCQRTTGCEQAVVEVSGTQSSRCLLGSHQMTSFPDLEQSCISARPACVHLCYAKSGFPDAATPPGRFPIVGQMLNIGLAADTTADVIFSFVERETGLPATQVGSFYMSVFNMLFNERSRQSFGVFDDVTYFLSDPSQIAVGQDEREFGATKPVSRDIPSNILAMNSGQVQQAVTLMLGDGTNASYKAQLRAKGGDQTFVIGGANSLVCPPRPLCVQMTCPAGYSWRGSAATTLCSGSECTEADLSTCCEAVLPDDCQDKRMLTFLSDSVLHSNLNGVGPNFSSPKEIVYSNVFPESGHFIDLVVTDEEGTFETNAVAKNGVMEGFGNINLKGPGQATLKMTFTNRDANQDIRNLDVFPLWMSVFDLDTAVNEDGVETIELLTQGLQTQLTKGTEVVQNGNEFSGSQWGTGSDNPTSTFNLTDLQLDRSLSLLLKEPVLDFRVKLTYGSKGRNFIFGGASNMVCPKRAACSTHICPFGHELIVEPERRGCLREVCTAIDTPRCCQTTRISQCTPEHWLELSRSQVIWSNLGGIGPDVLKPESLFFGDVFPRSGDIIDLNITAVGEYTAPNPELNGAQHHFGTISFQNGTSTTLQFDFVNRSTGKAAVMQPFFFSVIDLKNTVKKVEVLAAAWLEVSSTSALKVDGKRVDASGTIARFGFPSHSLALDQRQKDGSVTMQMPGAASFRMTVQLRASGDDATRVLFSGTSNLVCPPRPLCSSYECPITHKLKESADYTACAGDTCTDADTDTCCNVVEGGECKGKGRQLRLHSLVHSNLAGKGPDFERPEGILYGDAVPGAAGGPVDLLVSSLKPTYSAFQGWQNGLVNAFGRIGVHEGEDANLSFSFISRKTQQPVRMEQFYFTVARMITAENGSHIREVEVTPAKKGFVSTATTLESNVPHKYTATAEAASNAIPTNALAFTNEQQNRAVTFLVPNTTSFNVAMDITPFEGVGGGLLLFAGPSNIVCPEHQPCSSFTCPSGFQLKEEAETIACAKSTCDSYDIATCCDPNTEFRECVGGLAMDRSVTVHSNLAGAGPSRSDSHTMLIGNVFPDSSGDDPIDLQITAADSYKPANAAMNRVEAGLGYISVQADTEFDFRFINRRTTEEVKVPPFMFTAFDVEPTSGSNFSIVVPEAQEVHVLKLSELLVQRVGHETPVTTLGSGTTVPNSPWNLTEDMLNRAAAVRMPTLSSFSLGVKVPTSGGRMFVFSGSSMLSCTKRALCHTYTCPMGYTAYEHKQFVACSGTQCTDEEDLLRCCHLEVPPVCSDGRVLDLGHHSLAYSNLGGTGPHTDAPQGTMLYADVLRHSNRDNIVDMKVVALNNEYTTQLGDDTRNGVHWAFGNLNLKPGTTSDLQVSFIDRETNKPETIDPFFLSFFHIDSVVGGGAEEVIQVLSPAPTVSKVSALTTLTQELNFFRAKSDLQGTDLTVMRTPMFIPQDALNQTVSFGMPKTSSMTLRLRVEDAPANATGADILFAGASPLVCPRRAPCTTFLCPSSWTAKPDQSLNCIGSYCTEFDLQQCCVRKSFTPCEAPNRLTFAKSQVLSNNLGLQGPDTLKPEGISIFNVFPESGTEVSMVVSATTPYKAGDILKNGLVNNSFINVNMEAGQNINLKVSLFSDDKPFKPPFPFYISFTDLDQENSSATESVAVLADYMNAFVTNNTQLAVETDDAGKLIVTANSTTYGNFGDNPTDALSMTASQKDRTVSYLFRPGTDIVTFQLTVSDGWAPRNILFAGVTNAVCDNQVTCDTFTCPFGMKPNQGTISCAGPTCNNEDIHTCCAF